MKSLRSAAPAPTWKKSADSVPVAASLVKIEFSSPIWSMPTSKSVMSSTFVNAFRAVLKTNVSASVPPVSVSLPAPPFKVSVPAPPGGSYSANVADYRKSSQALRPIA